MRIKILELRNLLESKLRSLGLTKHQSAIVTDEYIQGELKGKSSHGVFGFIRSYKKMKTVKRGPFRVSVDKPAYAFIEGNKEIGQIVADYAIRLVIKKAKRSGVAMVGGRNIQAFLRPGTWAEYAARQGMIALCFIYGGSPLMAPTGAREAILSTNPIGIGIPYEPQPLVIDMASSKRAFYHVRLARTLGKRIKSDWGIDAQGQATTDPNKLGAMLPFGGYKGYALGLAWEILTGPLVRVPVGKRWKFGRGFLFLAINPLAFTAKSLFARETSKLIQEIKRAKKMPGQKEIFIPGEQSFRREKKNLRSGYLTVEENIIRQIKKL